jgi:hypothetical protein
VTSLGYIAGSAILTPDLWIEPLAGGVRRNHFPAPKKSA